MRRATMTYGGQSFEVVSLPDLIQSKTSAGREIDLEDVRLLTADNKVSDSEE
jgi:hypothetical protein